MKPVCDRQCNKFRPFFGAPMHTVGGTAVYLYRDSDQFYFLRIRSEILFGSQRLAAAVEVKEED